MSDRIIAFSELVDKNLLEIGAGRPRSAGLDRYPLPILRVADVLEGGIEPSIQTYTPVTHSQEMGPKTSKPGDVVLTTKGTVGRVAIMPSEGPTFAYSPQLCYFRSFANGPLRPRYLFYWFKSKEFWNQADALKSQTDMADFLSLSDVHSLTMRVPSSEEQAAVTDVLSALDDKIATNDRIIEIADKLTTAELAKKLSGRNMALGDEAIVTMGSSPPGESYNEIAQGVPFYQGVRDFGMRFPKRRIWTTSPVRMADPTDTLVSVRAPVGRTNFANEVLCIGRGIAALRSRHGRPMALFHQVRAAHGAWASYEAVGTVFGSINKKQLEAVEIPEVRPREADSLERRLVSLEQRIAAALSESTHLARTRDELLPLLMSGKVRVRDAERTVEEVT